MKKLCLCTEKERLILDRMLCVDELQHEKLKIQLEGLMLGEVDEMLIKLISNTSDLQEKTKKLHAYPVDCTYFDSDGGLVFVDLLLDEQDVLTELNVWKPDGTKIVRHFSDAELTIIPTKLNVPIWRV